jgi:hypothetical protein
MVVDVPRKLMGERKSTDGIQGRNVKEEGE